ncbi:unnamed protein product [Brassica rapa]|uniref:Uncharacterized protein n=1 Tax=Brassica campestris TaxID=3711 RepID=A0A8D9HUT2_BRACM|nr:unnamed protein product [Brassica rapa]
MAMNPVRTTRKSFVHPERRLNQKKFETQFWSSQQTVNQVRKLRIEHNHISNTSYLNLNVLCCSLSQYFLNLAHTMWLNTFL